MASQSELRLARLIDEREIVRGKHESKLAEVEAREDKTLTALDGEQVKVYRERAADLDIEIRELSAEVDATNKSIEEAKAIRRAMAGTADGIDIEGDGVVYRTMAAYARDVILTSTGQRAAQIQTQFGDKEEMQRAAERLQMIKRAPTNTTSTTVAGLIPAQHIDQIYQVINASRNLVATAEKAELVRGQVTFPQVDTKPVVLVQNTEKTEGGTTGLAVSMVTATASTYLGGGDLSWQAVNWSTPNALDLWFRLAAANYALKTETDAATVVSASGFLNNISSTVAASPTFAVLMTGIGAGIAEVWANSGRVANTVYMAPDIYGYLVGLTSSAFTQFSEVGANNIGPLQIVVSRGLNAGEIIVGDSAGLLVAETPGAPVELRVVEPSIGGYEVGIIGAFEAVVTDNGAFATVSTAS
jgi:hypothetical protein